MDALTGKKEEERIEEFLLTNAIKGREWKSRSPSNRFNAYFLYIVPRNCCVDLAKEERTFQAEVVDHPLRITHMRGDGELTEHSSEAKEKYKPGHEILVVLRCEEMINPAIGQ